MSHTYNTFPKQCHRLQTLHLVLRHTCSLSVRVSCPVILCYSLSYNIALSGTLSLDNPVSCPVILQICLIPCHTVLYHFIRNTVILLPHHTVLYVYSCPLVSYCVKVRCSAQCQHVSLFHARLYCISVLCSVIFFHLVI